MLLACRMACIACPFLRVRFEGSLFAMAAVRALDYAPWSGERSIEFQSANHRIEANKLV